MVECVRRISPSVPGPWSVNPQCSRGPNGENAASQDCDASCDWIEMVWWTRHERQGGCGCVSDSAACCRPARRRLVRARHALRWWRTDSMTPPPRLTGKPSTRRRSAAAGPQADSALAERADRPRNVGPGTIALEMRSTAANLAWGRVQDDLKSLNLAEPSALDRLVHPQPQSMISTRRCRCAGSTRSIGQRIQAQPK
jgi:hypothetical protein